MKHGFTSWLLWQVIGKFSADYRYVLIRLLVCIPENYRCVSGKFFLPFLFDFLDCLMAARWPLCLRALNINAL